MKHLLICHFFNDKTEIKIRGYDQCVHSICSILTFWSGILIQLLFIIHNTPELIEPRDENQPSVFDMKSLTCLHETRTKTAFIFPSEQITSFYTLNVVFDCFA